MLKKMMQVNVNLYLLYVDAMLIMQGNFHHMQTLPLLVLVVLSNL